MIAIVGTTALLVSGCSGGDDKPEPTKTSAAGTPQETNTAKPTEGLDRVCDELTPKAIGKLLGTRVEQGQVARGGCGFFNSKNPAALSISFDQGEFDDGADAMRTAQSQIEGSFDGKTTELGDLGDAAFYVVGATGPNTKNQAAGAVRVEDVVVQVTLLQTRGMKPKRVASTIEKALRLSAKRLVD